MKPEGMSTGEPVGQCFLTKKDRDTGRDITFSSGCCYNWMRCQEELQMPCYQLDDIRMAGWGEKTKFGP